MQRSNKYGFFAIGALVLSIVLGANIGVLAQGKGHNGDRGGGPPPGKGGGSPQQAQRPQPQAQRQEQRQQPQAQRQEQRQQPQRQAQQQRQPQQQQPRFERAPVQRQQQPVNQGWQNRGGQNQSRTRVEQARPQQQPVYNADRGQVNGRSGQNQQRQENRVNSAPQQMERTASGNNAWPNNYGYQRSNQVHTRNADRQAMRDQETYSREQARLSGRTFDRQNFTRDYQQRVQWRDNTLRNVISNALIGNSDYSYYTPQYNSYGYGSQYDPYYYDNGNYSNGYPQYQSYYATPYSFGYQTFGYQPYDYSYSNSPYDNGGYYPYYSDYDTNDYPLDYVTSSYGGGGFLSRMFSQLLAVGYDNGYQEGLYAQSNGYGDQYYSDPYGYQNTSYDPYSYSVGENRRCLSEGYKLGYQDAMNRNNRYDPYSGGGNTDLVSLLIGSVLNRS